MFGLSVCLFVGLYPINVKKVEPVEPNFICDNSHQHITKGNVFLTSTTRFLTRTTRTNRVDSKVSQRLGLRFYRSNSLILFCSPLQVHFSTIKHLLLTFLYNNWQNFCRFLLESVRPLNHSGQYQIYDGNLIESI